VTFKDDVDASTICNDGDSSGTCNNEDIIPENVQIYEETKGNSCKWSSLLGEYEECDLTNVTDVKVTQTGRIFVFTPAGLLGNPTENSNYLVRLDPAILDSGW
jgi:hypothetical protein